MAKREIELPWYQRAAELMVRSSASLRQAAAELDLPLTTEELEKIGKKRMFQEVLRLERNKYATEVANDPSATKSSLIGLAYLLIQKLIEEGSYDKALEGIQKVSRLQGWDKSDNINIFANLTTVDIEAERKKLLAKLEAPSVSAAGAN